MNDNFKNNPSDSGDDFIIGKGFNLQTSDKVEEKPMKHRKKRKSVVKSIILIFSIIIISFGLAFSLIFLGADYLGIGFGRGSDKCTVEVEKGMGTARIADVLYESGAIKSKLAFRLYSRLKGFDSKYKYGVYIFESESGYESICEMLMTDGEKAQSVTVTIPEGIGINDYIKNVNGEDVTVKGIATILEESGVCSREDFIAALENYKYDSKLLESVNIGKTYYELEGYLYPETYDFYSFDSKECAALAVDKMIKESEKRIGDDMFNRANEMGYTFNEILTMASIIQMESGQNTAEMPNVAAVFYNRLNSKNFSTLGSSPTCYYGNSFKNDDGRYNTYNVEGLPPGPLCSPSIDAIKAALYPTEDVPYYYFITDSDGNFYFHKTLSEQNKKISELKKKGKWIYEYFN